MLPCGTGRSLIVLSACVRYSERRMLMFRSTTRPSPTGSMCLRWPRGRGSSHHVGLGVTVDTFYGTKPWLRTDPPKTETDGMIARWAQLGAFAMEMEAATLMVVGSLTGLRTGLRYCRVQCRTRKEADGPPTRTP